MTSLVFVDDDSQAKLWRAVIISLGLHALVVTIYPHLSQIRLPQIPERLEIEFFSVKAPTPPVSEQQVAPVIEKSPELPKMTTATPKVTQPVDKPKSVLTAPANSEADYRVPEQTTPAKVEPAQQITQSAPATTSVSSNESTSHAASESVNKDAKPSMATNAPVSSESEELTASDNDAWGDYGDQLRTLVNKSKQYPAIAIRRHLEGDVTVVAQFVRGELTQVSLVESSKHLPLDEEAMRMVKKAIAQLGIKESLKKKTFKITIPVGFRLE